MHFWDLTLRRLRQDEPLGQLVLQSEIKKERSDAHECCVNMPCPSYKLVEPVHQHGLAGWRQAYKVLVLRVFVSAQEGEKEARPPWKLGIFIT